MLLGRLLHQLIDEYQKQEAVFSSQLDPKTGALMREETDYTFSCFKSLAHDLDAGLGLDTAVQSSKYYLVVARMLL